MLSRVKTLKHAYFSLKDKIRQYFLSLYTRCYILLIQFHQYFRIILPQTLVSTVIILGSLSQVNSSFGGRLLKFEEVNYGIDYQRILLILLHLDYLKKIKVLLNL